MEEFLRRKMRKPTFQRVRLSTVPGTCEDCGGNMAITNGQRSCMSCGLVDTTYHQTVLVRDYYSTPPKYKPSKHFEAVLNRLQGVKSKACDRFDKEYIEDLVKKLDDDYTLQNIHEHLPNKDQRYLNYIYSEVARVSGNTDEKLYIDPDHRDFLKTKFNRCYEEYQNVPEALRGKRPCALNILEVVLDCYPKFDYIRPFIYTKFKLNNDIYNRLRDVCSNKLLFSDSRRWSTL